MLFPAMVTPRAGPPRRPCPACPTILASAPDTRNRVVAAYDGPLEGWEPQVSSPHPASGSCRGVLVEVLGHVVGHVRRGADELLDQVALGVDHGGAEVVELVDDLLSTLGGDDGRQ